MIDHNANQMPEQTLRPDNDGRAMLGEPMTMLDFKRFLKLCGRPGNAPAPATEEGKREAEKMLVEFFDALGITDRIWTPEPHALLFAFNLFDKVPEAQREACVQVVMAMVCQAPDVMLAHTMFSVKRGALSWVGPPKQENPDGSFTLRLDYAASEFDATGAWRGPW